MRKLFGKAAALLISLNLVLTAVSCPAAASGTVPESVCVGGMPFGVKFYSQGILIVGFSEIETADGIETPALDAGLKTGDIITRVNGSEVKTAGEFIGIIENAQNPLQVTYLRGGDENTVSFVPSVSKEDGKRKTGMWVRDTTAGIGTVTFVLPDTGEFAGLGHGICDAETGELLEMKRGTVVDVMISGVTKGVAGSPGELKGYFTSDKSGVLLGNTLCGVYGVMSNVPWETIPETAEVASRADIRPGEAYIWCTLDGNRPQKYSINITEIRRDVSMQDNRCFSIEVTDPVLLEKTGGIVQGMSGSPIIQNGKLIGAVTHVLINDPSKGYGIFIENMLEAAR
ncbi:MAG: SpoIVB peptidase [Clostridia bacterium]|nr:SpoIVB peptidase [Clostridia bacterium]